MSVPQMRIKDVAQSVAKKIETENAQEKGQSWNDAQPGRLRHEAASGVEHIAPGRFGWLGAKTKEAQRGFQQDRICESDGRLHEQRRDDIRQQLANDDAGMTHADAASRLDVLLLKRG